MKVQIIFSIPFFVLFVPSHTCLKAILHALAVSQSHGWDQVRVTLASEPNSNSWFISATSFIDTYPLPPSIWSDQRIMPDVMEPSPRTIKVALLLMHSQLLFTHLYNAQSSFIASQTFLFIQCSFHPFIHPSHWWPSSQPYASHIRCYYPLQLVLICSSHLNTLLANS